MEPRLRVIAGGDKAKVYPLPRGRGFTIGNVARQSDICLSDPRLSPVHCRVENKDGEVSVTDLGSAAGVFVNGKRVGQSELGHGDTLKLGETELTYESIYAWTEASTPFEVKPGTRLEDSVFLDPPRAHEHVSAADLGIDFAPTSTDDVRQLANTGFGKFQLGRVIGSGHHGVVFRARRHDGSELALKVLDPAFPHNETEAAHFKEIMHARLNLRHPNLVTLIGIGRHSSCTWLALELVEGESIAQIVSQFQTSGVPSWTEAYRLAVHLARALNVAARHHMVHRGLTPANVLYRRLDHLYKLADLSLVQALAGSQLRRSTQRARSRDELPYVAPEQLQAEAAPDGRSDLYRLGVLVYLMLTGKPPFLGKNASETITLIRETPPAPPRTFQKSMPEVLQSAVLTLLVKRPEDRFQTAAELLGELARIEPDPT
jgi:serine/threonine protein kinase